MVDIADHSQDDEKVKLKGEVGSRFPLFQWFILSVVIGSPLNTPQVHRLIAPRDQKYQSNFVEFKRSTKIVYRRYAGLFFCACVDANDNELAYLEAIHFFVEVLDQFFGNVCELDLVFNFYKVRTPEWRFVCAEETWEMTTEQRLQYHSHRSDG